MISKVSIRHLMKLANISERKLEVLTGISRTSINHKLNHYRGAKFTMNELEKISNVFHVSIENLEV